jgi:hypothetical protein
MTMRPLLLCLFCLPALLSAGPLDDLMKTKELQAAVVLNVNNPQINAKLKESAKGADVAKLEKFLKSMDYVAFCVMESDGVRAELVVGIGQVTIGVQKLLVQDGHPAQLIDEDGVILAVTLNGEALKGARLQEFAKALEDEADEAPKRK